MKKNTRKKGNGFGKKMKKGVVIFTIGFVCYGIIANSTYVNTRIESVYSDMQVKYNIVNEDKQVEPDIITPETNQEIVSVLKKNYNIDVNSDLRIPSNVTVEDMEKMLAGTSLAGLGNAFVQAEKEHGVNALYMAGLAWLESGAGTSGYAVKRNNLYGWNAIDSNPDLAKHFASKESATLFVASKLKQNYLTEGGAYHEGYSARSIDVHYCTDKKHADKIMNIINGTMLKKLG